MEVHPVVGLDLCAPELDHVMVHRARCFADAMLDNFASTPASSLFKDKLVVLFGLPGAFTGVCSQYHVPSYLESYDAIKRLGVDTVCCLSVNDPFVMDAWADDLETAGKIEMIADGMGMLTKALLMDTVVFGATVGYRCKRCSMVIHDGVVQAVNVEQSLDDLEVSDGSYMEECLARWK